MKPLLVCALFAIGCAGSPSGGTCSDAIGFPSTTDCETCLAASCTMEVSTCYGDGWQSSHLAGACATYTACLCKCAVRDSSCAVSCAPDSSNACLTCQDALAACVDSHCQSPCSPTMLFDGGTTSPPSDM